MSRPLAGKRRSGRVVALMQGTSRPQEKKRHHRDHLWPTCSSDSLAALLRAARAATDRIRGEADALLAFHGLVWEDSRWHCAEGAGDGLNQRTTGIHELGELCAHFMLR